MKLELLLAVTVVLATRPLDDASKTSPVRFACFIFNVSSEIVGWLLSNAAGSVICKVWIWLFAVCIFNVLVDAEYHLLTFEECEADSVEYIE